jgi:hypothetical protein
MHNGMENIFKKCTKTYIYIYITFETVTKKYCKRAIMIEIRKAMEIE